MTGVLPTIGYLLEKYKGVFMFNFGTYKVAIVSKPSIIEVRIVDSGVEFKNIYIYVF